MHRLTAEIVAAARARSEMQGRFFDQFLADGLSLVQVRFSRFADTVLGLFPTEVTQDQWRAVSGRSGLDWKPSAFEGRDRPVERVSWDDAREFCRRMGRQTGRPIRLPTEAEWEYA